MYHAANNLAFADSHAAEQRAARRDPAADLAWRVLDELDFGLILVSPEGLVQHANHLGREELVRSRFLRHDRNRICGSTPAASAELLRGIRAAARGRRQLLDLPYGGSTLPLACVPLFQPYGDESASVLLMMGRQAGTRNLATTFFARSHGLTPAEESVLRGLCDGLDVQDIADAHNVCESTVRTQIRSLREKTGAGSIRVLVQRLAALPPVVPVTLAGGSHAAAQWEM